MEFVGKPYPRIIMPPKKQIVLTDNRGNPIMGGSGLFKIIDGVGGVFGKNPGLNDRHEELWRKLGKSIKVGTDAAKASFNQPGGGKKKKRAQRGGGQMLDHQQPKGHY